MVLLILILSATVFSYLFACLVCEEWIDPLKDYKAEIKRQKREQQYLAAEARQRKERYLQWKKEMDEKERRQLQAVETKKRQAEKAAAKAARKAAHEERTLANKLRKEEARMEYSLRTWGLPYIEEPK